MIRVKKIEIVPILSIWATTLVFLGIISTGFSYNHQVVVAQISDLYLNGEPANLYVVVHHGYPLHWVTTTDPIPLELLDTELFVSPLFLANFALHTCYPLYCAVTTNPISTESLDSDIRTYQGLIISHQFNRVNFILDTLFYTGIYSIPLLAVIVYRRKHAK